MPRLLSTVAALVAIQLVLSAQMHPLSEIEIRMERRSFARTILLTTLFQSSVSFLRLASVTRSTSMTVKRSLFGSVIR